MKRMEGSDISNPIIASWITSFIRSIISELLHYINILNGSVISVTTDGFICNIENLEEKVFKYSGKQHTLLKEYKKLRFDLSNNPICLEVKNSDPIKELFSWCTRGQLSASSNLVAATGFQRSDSLEVIQDKFLDVFNKPDKSLYFIQKTLRNAKDIYKNGGHVTPVYRDQIYRLLFDNKRVIIDNKIDSTLDPNSKNILDSKPFTTAELSNLFRFLSNYSKDGIYSKSLGSSFNNNYKNQSEIIIRNFLKALLNNELNLNYKHFKNYDSIINFIIQFKPENNFKITPNYLAQLKRRGNFIKIPPSPELDRFIDYVKKTFPNFDDKGFRK